jgi:hypothetical protein
MRSEFNLLKSLIKFEDDFHVQSDPEEHQQLNRLDTSLLFSFPCCQYQFLDLCRIRFCTLEKSNFLLAHPVDY